MHIDLQVLWRATLPVRVNPARPCSDSASLPRVLQARAGSLERGERISARPRSIHWAYFGLGGWCLSLRGISYASAIRARDQTESARCIRRDPWTDQDLRGQI